MRILKAIFIFYQKLIIPSMLLSCLLGSVGLWMTGTFSLTSVGITYLFFSPLFHYFIYEVKNKNEYYFYYNLGLSKLVLWVASTVISLFISLILMLL